MRTAWMFCARPLLYAKLSRGFFEALILENHLHGCVPEGIREGREEAVIERIG